MERWFVVRTVNDFFGLGSVDDKIIFLPDHLKEWMGKTLAEIKPFILENNGKATELTK